MLNKICPFLLTLDQTLSAFVPNRTNQLVKLAIVSYSLRDSKLSADAKILLNGFYCWITFDMQQKERTQIIFKHILELKEVGNLNEYQ